MSAKARRRRKIVAAIEDGILFIGGVAFVAAVILLASLLLKACHVL